MAFMLVSRGAVPKRTIPMVRMEINLTAIKSALRSPSSRKSKGPILTRTVSPERKGKTRTNIRRKMDG
jgi:hypothetical protein